MANDGWGSKWPDNGETANGAMYKLGVAEIKPDVPENWDNWPEISKELAIKIDADFDKEFPKLTAWDLGSGERTVLTKFNDNGDVTHTVISQTELKVDTSSRLIAHNNKIFKTQGSNLVDEQAYLYFQCEGCSTILDPHTKSFAKLQEHRVNAGWKCVWNLSGMGYKVYCAECGEKIEK